MRNYYPQAGLRLIFSIAFTTTLLIATSSISFAQRSNLKVPGVKSKPSIESTSPAEDVLQCRFKRGIRRINVGRQSDEC